MKKLLVDEELCVSCGNCASVAPEVFAWETGEKAKVKEEADLEVNTALIDQAIAGCPVQAISWVDEGGEEEVAMDSEAEVIPEEAVVEEPVDLEETV